MIQAIGVWDVIIFYTREERSDRAVLATWPPGRRPVRFEPSHNESKPQLIQTIMKPSYLRKATIMQGSRGSVELPYHAHLSEQHEQHYNCAVNMNRWQLNSSQLNRKQLNKKVVHFTLVQSTIVQCWIDSCSVLFWSIFKCSIKICSIDFCSLFS